MQKAKDIMTRNPRCCKLTSSVLEAIEVMREEDCGIVPIVDENEKCVGVITDRDLCLHVIPARRDPGYTELQEIMTRNPVTCSDEDNMDDVLKKMKNKMVRRIPVVDVNNKCIGIISEVDIALREEDKSKVSE